MGSKNIFSYRKIHAYLFKMVWNATDRLVFLQWQPFSLWWKKEDIILYVVILRTKLIPFIFYLLLKVNLKSFLSNFRGSLKNHIVLFYFATTLFVSLLLMRAFVTFFCMVFGVILAKQKAELLSFMIIHSAGGSHLFAKMR